MVPISIELGNVRELGEKAEGNEIYTGDFTNIHRGCTNYHFRVFRALGTEATLTLSDWGSPGAPGGAVGNQIIWDYIKVQPYWVPVAAEVVPLGEGWTLFSTGEPNPVSWDSFQISDGTDTYNVLDANASSWIHQTIYYFDAASQQFKLTPTDNQYLYYYHGYWIWSKRSGLELI